MSIRSISEFGLDIRTSPRLVTAGLTILGPILAIVAEFHPDLSARSALLNLVLVVLSASALAWALTSWRPQVGRWSVAVVAAAIVVLANRWLGMPGLLPLLMVPTALSACLVSPLAATVVAMGESLLVLALGRWPSTASDLPTVVITLGGIWTVVGVMHLAYAPLSQFAGWLEEYFDRSQEELGQARQRKAELEQALEGLANANRQLALANERMGALRTAALEAQSAKTAFVANVSHEFRTPLNMIIGLVEFMVEQPQIYAGRLPPKLRADLDVVYRNCKHLSNMINDVLDLTQTEAGRLTIHRERVNLRDLIDSALTVVAPLLANKRLEVEVRFPDDAPTVYCDRTRVRQVIVNLVSNAARFTEQGGVTIDAKFMGPDVCITVRDTGPGIAPEDVEAVFEPFCQGSAPLWRDKGGTGLGLSISRQFVKLHGGRMWLESELGVGTSVHFSLPISAPEELGARAGRGILSDWTWREQAFQTRDAMSAKEIAKPRVIVCDETGGLRQELARFTDEAEFIEASEVAASGGLHACLPSVVLLNGATLGSVWGLMEGMCSEVPGVPLVGCSLPQSRTTAEETGAIGYLVKPVTASKLADGLRQFDRPLRQVLVVEDDREALDLYCRMLRSYDASLQITAAASGIEALERVRRQPPDLVLLDVMLPGMDGWQVLEALREDPGLDRTAVLFVSAQDPLGPPPTSRFLLATVDEGLRIGKLIQCSMEMSALLTKARPMA